MSAPSPLNARNQTGMMSGRQYIHFKAYQLVGYFCGLDWNVGLGDGRIGSAAVMCLTHRSA